MTKHTRFRFLTFAFLWLFVFYFGLGYIQRIMIEYLDDFERYIRPVYWAFGFVRTMSILGMIAIGLYILYSSYSYLSSKFYRLSSIPVHEAFFHGYFDLAYVYDRLTTYGKEVTYDTKTKSVIVTYDKAIFYITVRDIFGRLQGEAKDDTWYIVSRKRKQYGNVRYLKRKPLKNPLMENKAIIARMPKDEGVVVSNLACLTGFRRNTFGHDAINTVYEIEGILQHYETQIV